MLNRNQMRDNDFAKMLVRIVLQANNPESGPAFISRLTSEIDPEIQVKLHDFVVMLICSWADQTDLSRENAEAIEDCRKICDLMGWAFASW